MRFPSIFSNLRLVLIMQVALPVLLVLAMILAIGLSMVGQFIEERMQRDLQQVARTIHLPVSCSFQVVFEICISVKHSLETLQVRAASNVAKFGNTVNRPSDFPRPILFFHLCNSFFSFCFYCFLSSN